MDGLFEGTIGLLDFIGTAGVAADVKVKKKNIRVSQSNDMNITKEELKALTDRINEL